MTALEIAKEAKKIIQENPYGIMDFLEQEIIILPTVFPADCTTPFLAIEMSKIAKRIVESKGTCKALEMGTGSGAAILTVAKEDGVEAHASDINPMSALGVQANALFWGVECQVYQGSLFESIPKQEFDLIFWNIPFIPTDPGGVEAVEFRSGFDPGYKYQKQFLSEVRDYLSEEGELYLGTDFIMCDTERLYALFEEMGFEKQAYKKNLENWRGVEFEYQIFKLVDKK